MVVVGGLVLNALSRGQELTPAYFHLNFRFSFCKIRVIRNSWESAQDVRGISDAGARTNHRRLFFVGSQSEVRVAGSSQGRVLCPHFCQLGPCANAGPVLVPLRRRFAFPRRELVREPQYDVTTCASSTITMDTTSDLRNTDVFLNTFDCVFTN